jgi:hypothetical protein
MASGVGRSGLVVFKSAVEFENIPTQKEIVCVGVPSVAMEFVAVVVG